MQQPNEGTPGIDDARWIAQALSSELLSVADEVEKLNGLLERWLRSTAVDEAAIIQFQAADRVGQTLQELAAFLDRYVASASQGVPDPAAESLAHVRLGALAVRLRGARGEEVGDDETIGTHAELF